MNILHTRLRVKLKSLAAEARIIRHEELRFKRGQRDNEIYHDLHNHRTCNVRIEARAAQLAYGFLRGRTYAQLEQKCYTPPDWARVVQNVHKFGPLTSLLPNGWQINDKDSQHSKIVEWRDGNFRLEKKAA